MSEDSEDEASKTEEPTHKKLEDARKKGKMVSTRELNHFFMILACIFFLTQMLPGFGRGAMGFLTPFITRPESFMVDAASIADILKETLIDSILLLSLTFLLTIVSAIAPSILQGKWVFAAEQIKPKLEKINPLAGAKRLFGKKAIIEFIKNLSKVVALGVTCIMVILPYKNELPLLVSMDITQALEFSGRMATRILVATCLFLFLLSIGDYLYQRFSFMKSMRMSKHEVKEEHKQQEGDPHHKQKVKQIRMERAAKRMMANVPKADVVITNPTHFAVALQYDEKKMAVPKVVAKGADEVAARIREIAQENRITIVRNPPLARALYDTTDIDDEIPMAQYQAVAKIISYVYKLKGKRPTPAQNRGYGAKGKPVRPRR